MIDRAAARPAPPEPYGPDRHFASIDQQASAARLGMWIFIGSELLLFAALFVLYAAYRGEHPETFAAAIRHNEKTMGSINTLLLLVSSYFVAAAVHGRRAADILATRRRLMAALGLGTLFLLIKAAEWRLHILHGMVPGAPELPGLPAGAPGLSLFYGLYFLSTGLHALHVIGGMGALLFCLRRTYAALPIAAHRLEAAGLYWHLVDVIWIVLWPLYYLTGGAG